MRKKARGVEYGQARSWSSKSSSKELKKSTSTGGCWRSKSARMSTGSESSISMPMDTPTASSISSSCCWLYKYEDAGGCFIAPASSSTDTFGWTAGLPVYPCDSRPHIYNKAIHWTTKPASRTWGAVSIPITQIAPSTFQINKLFSKIQNTPPSLSIYQNQTITARRSSRVSYKITVELLSWSWNYSCNSVGLKVTVRPPCC